MLEAPIPGDEKGRLAELYSYGLLDSEEERSFDDISHLVQDLAGTPIAVISLVDENRQWFKSCLGLDVRESPRNISFCGHTIVQRTPLIIEDALKDPRFCDNPLVLDAPGIRFYAGFPLISPNGMALGSLCAIDLVPNHLNQSQISSLQRLARQVMRLMELRRQTHLLQASQTALQECASDGVGDDLAGQPTNLDAWPTAVSRLLGRDQLLSTIELMLTLPNPPCFAVLRLFLKERNRVSVTLGNRMGDQLLERTAARLFRLLPPDASAARLGENELLVLLPHVAEQNTVARLAVRLTAALDDPIQLNGRLLSTSVAIGIALYQGNYNDVETLLADAAIAESNARRLNGSAFSFIDLATRLQARNEYILEASLRQALHNGELVPYLQPLVALSNGKLMGFECLVRWRTTDGQVKNPAEFLPAAYRAGLTGELDLQVVQQALCLIPELAAAEPPQPLLISVNLSGELLNNEAQRLRLLELIDNMALPPQWQLQVEILEDALQQSSTAFESFLRQLSERKVVIAIDDFGTGYSSLSRLHALPFSAIKIDRSFVQRIDDPEQPSNKLLSAMQLLSRDLGLRTTAEGVETEAQRRWLRQAGFSWGQGYLFTRPMPLQEALAFMKPSSSLGLGARIWAKLGRWLAA
ncbi:MAG: sensor domain-containing phosphodiesterase [Prochlorococcaceae cyanobacterium]